MDFNVANLGENTVTINAITEVSQVLQIEGDFLTGFAVDAVYENTTGYTVVLSAKYLSELSRAAP